MTPEDAAEMAELAERIKLLRAALRPGPATEGKDITANGHISSAISKLERRRELLLRG